MIRPALAAAAFVVLTALDVAGSHADPLPSWNSGPAKAAIVEFVDAVTKPGSEDYVDPADRIARFDNDGTPWAEQPIYFQVAFTVDEIRRLAANHPEWRTTEPFASVLAGNVRAALAGGEKVVDALMAATYADVTTGEFQARVAAWVALRSIPRSRRPTATSSTSRSWSSSPTCVRRGSRPSSSPAAAPTSCASSRMSCTGSRRSR